MVQDRLRALLAPGHDSFKRHNAALALAVVGDQSPEIVAYAQDAVAKQLPDPHTSAPPTTPGNAGDAAVLAACLPMERRVELARYYCERILDTTAAENTRVTRAVSLIESLNRSIRYCRNWCHKLRLPMSPLTTQSIPSCGRTSNDTLNSSTTS